MSWIARVSIASGTRRCVVCSRVTTSLSVQISNPDCRETIAHPECLSILLPLLADEGRDAALNACSSLNPR